MEIEGQMKKFIRKLIIDRWIKVREGESTLQNRQTRPGKARRGSTKCDSLLSGNYWHLAIYIATRNQKVAARALQGVTNKLDVEKNHLAQQPPWLIHNAHFGYGGDLPANNNNDKNSTKIPKKLIQMG